MTDSDSHGAEPAPRLERADGGWISHRRNPGSGPGVVFLPGFRSDMAGTKAAVLDAYCRARGQAYLRFDYSGHGESSGKLTDGTIGVWAADAVETLDALTEGPQVLVGSSMGGWTMLLAALARPERIAGLVGIAPAPDFTEDLIWSVADDAMKAALETEGVWHEPSQYDDEPTPITRALVEDGRNHLLLRAPIPLSCPVRLIHGMKDPDVPWQTSLRIADRLASTDVEITLIKDGDHRLSEAADLARLTDTLGRLLDQLSA
ncbi:MAG: alpha/beta hydrolase [Alphaproteobacteria bacterium]|nr:alpha/beta hydrolase [Alphaproteobacteria bacterium]